MVVTMVIVVVVVMVVVVTMVAMVTRTIATVISILQRTDVKSGPGAKHVVPTVLLQRRAVRVEHHTHPQSTCKMCTHNILIQCYYTHSLFWKTCNKLRYN